VSIEDFDVFDGADSPPDLGFQQWTTKQMNDDRSRVFEFARSVEFVSGHPDAHLGEVAVVAHRRTGGDEFAMYAWK
jgi:hypothetical protein